MPGRIDRKLPTAIDGPGAFHLAYNNKSVIRPASLTIILALLMLLSACGGGGAATTENSPPPDSQAPSVPQGLTVTATNAGQVNLSWTASTDSGGSGLAGYRIYRNGSTSALVSLPASATSYSDTSVLPSTQYSYALQAYDEASNQSALSSSQAVTTPAIITVPAAPAGVIATAGDSGALVSWTAPANGGSPITRYAITSSPGGIIATVTGDLTSVTFGGLANGVSYTFTVFATNAVGDGPQSAPSPPIMPAVSDQQAPSVPSGLALTAVSSTQINLSWAASTDSGGSGLSGYRVYRNGSATALTTVAAPATTFSDTSVSANTQYSYALRAFDGAGNQSALSGSQTATTPSTITVPSAPTGVAAAARDSSAVVSWVAPANGGSQITGYTVTSSPGAVTVTVAGTFTTATVGGLANGVSYTFKVFATNAIGNGPQSAASAPVTPAVSDQQAPSVPTGLALTAVSSTRIDLSWTASTDSGGSGLGGYRIYRNGSTTLLATVTAPARTYSDANLSPATQYSYAVLAFDGANNQSALSASQSITTPSTTTVPGAPTAVVATAGDTSAVVSWTAPGNGGSPITGYTVTSSPGAITVTVGGNQTGATVTGLTNGAAYTFTVLATNAVGNGPQSAASAAITPSDQVAPSVPTGLALTAISSTRVDLSWTASTDTGSSGLVGYRIYRNGSTTPLATVTAPVTTYSDTTVSPSTQYSYALRAYDGAGNQSALSTSQNITTPATITVPGAPTGVTATAGDTKAGVSWTAPNNGGSAITAYTVTSNPGAIAVVVAGSLTAATVNGLTNAVSYTFTVVATNAIGDGPASAASNAVTPAAAGSGVAFPLRHSTNHRYLEDQNGVPFPILGRASWGIIGLSPANYQAALTDALARGFNAIEFRAPDGSPQDNFIPFDGAGNLPFTTKIVAGVGAGAYTGARSETPDFTTPNPAYWTYLDTFIDYCASKNIAVLWFPAYVGYNGTEGWIDFMVTNGTTRMQTFGAYVANRYQNRKNIIWMLGGDRGTGTINPFTTAESNVEQALIAGLTSVVGQQSTQYSAEWSSESIGTDQTAFGSRMTLNGAYSFTGDTANQARR